MTAETVRRIVTPEVLAGYMRDNEGVTPVVMPRPYPALHFHIVFGANAPDYTATRRTS